MSRWSEHGDTLVEVLVAMVILAIAGVALLAGFATSITATSTHRTLATLDSNIRAATNEAISLVQQSKYSSNPVFTANTCTNAAANPTTNTSYVPPWNLSGSFSVTSYNVQYWSGSAFGTACTQPYGPQLWTMTITSASGSYSTQASTVIYDPNPVPVSGGTNATKLVFMQPTSPGSGTVNAAVSPQPIVAVEDGSDNDIVYSDASSVTLTASGGSGSLSSNCAGLENNGVITFSGCSFSAPGTYTVKASDGSLATATAYYTITAAPVAKLVFTSSSITQTASASAGTTAITVQEQDAFGAAVPGAMTIGLSSSSSTGIFSQTSGGTTPLTSVTIPAGQSSATFYYGDTTAGTPVLSASASGLQTGLQTEAINGAAPAKVVLTATPASAGVSGTTNVALGLQLIDQYGNSTSAGSSGLSLVLSTSSSKGFFNANSGGTGTAGGSVTIPFTSGVGAATEYYGDKTVGTPTITAKNGTSSWGTTPLTITVGPPATITLNTGSGQSTQVNSAFSNPLVATVTDAFGNLVSGASVTFSAPATGASGTFSGCSGGNPQTYQCVITTNASGQASSSTLTANTTAGTSYSISASASGTNTVNFSATNTAGSPAGVTLSATPSSASASSTTNTALGFQIVDQYGNSTTAATGGISLSLTSSSTKGVFSSSNNASGSATATVSFASGAGAATEYYGDQTAGSPTITAKNGSATWGTGLPVIVAKTTNDTMTIVTGSGQSATVGAAFATPLEVQDLDQFGNPVSGVSVTFAAPASGASGSFGTCFGGNPQTYQCVTLTNASGQATASAFTANTKSGSSYSVTTAASGVATPPTFSETNTAGAAAQVYITPTPTSMAASTTTAIKLGFQLVDQYGNNATAGTSGVTLSVSSTSTKEFFSTLSGGTGTLNTPVNVTFASGVGTATEYYGDESAGTWTVNALNGTSNWGSTSVTVTAKTTSDVMTIIAGNSQSTPASTAFATPLEVQDVDQFGNPVSGVNVTFAAPASGASGTFTSGGNCTSNPQTYQCVVTTNASGQATASTFTANATTGSYSVTTAATGVASPPTFAETNIHVTATSVASGTGTSSITTGSFSMTSGTTYVVTAFASRNGTISTPTPTVSGTSAPAMTLITTNTFGNQAANCYDSAYCYEWAWSFNATATSTATVGISFGSTPAGAVADVIALGGNSTTTPIVQSSTASGCNNSGCAIDTKTVTGNLTNAPAAGDITLQVLGSDDAMGTAPTWSTLNSNLYFRSATSASLDVNLASPGQQNETTSTSASGYAGNKDWGTIALEIGAI